jgi:hypothetical protein
MRSSTRVCGGGGGIEEGRLSGRGVGEQAVVAEAVAFVGQRQLGVRAFPEDQDPAAGLVVGQSAGGCTPVSSTAGTGLSSAVTAGERAIL